MAPAGIAVLPHPGDRRSAMAEAGLQYVIPDDSSDDILPMLIPHRVQARACAGPAP